MKASSVHGGLKRALTCMEDNNWVWRSAFAVFLVFYALMLLRHIGLKHLVWDEAAIALSAIDVWASAPELLVHPYQTVKNFVRSWPYYPPLLSMIIAADYRIFGISEFSVRVPCTVMSLLCLCVVYLFGKKIASEAVGFLAAVLLAAMPIYYWMGRFAFHDMPLTFFFTLALMFFYSGCEDGRLGRIVLSGAALGLGFLMKYPAILVAPVVASYLLVDRLVFNGTLGWKKLASFLLALELAFFVVLPWTYCTTTMSGMWQLWGKEIERGKEYKWLMAENWAGNILQMPEQMTTPIAVLGSLGLLYCLIRRKKSDYFLLLWVAAVFLFFVPYHKDARYTMPFLPAFALAGARLVSDCCSQTLSSAGRLDPHSFGGIRRFLSTLFVLVAVAGLVAPSFLSFYVPPPERVPMDKAARYIVENVERERSVMVLLPAGDFSHFAFIFYLRMEGLPFGYGVHTYTYGKSLTGELDLQELVEYCDYREIKYLVLWNQAPHAMEWLSYLTTDPTASRYFRYDAEFWNGENCVYVLAYGSG